jgi:hypothetical protein
MWSYKHYCHGVIIDPDFYSWSIEDAIKARNTEQRRVWFEENGGWEQYEDRFILVDEQPDPGNPGHTLRLCDFPREFNVYGREWSWHRIRQNRARIIFCDNASLDRDGTRRRYGLIYPRSWGDDALTVMARSFGLTREQYQGMTTAK